jgi:hypothetical protein
MRLEILNVEYGMFNIEVKTKQLYFTSIFYIDHSIFIILSGVPEA